jgi:hypothetical protein
VLKVWGVRFGYRKKCEGLSFGFEHQQAARESVARLHMKPSLLMPWLLRNNTAGGFTDVLPREKI